MLFSFKDGPGRPFPLGRPPCRRAARQLGRWDTFWHVYRAFLAHCRAALDCDRGGAPATGVGLPSAARRMKRGVERGGADWFPRAD